MTLLLQGDRTFQLRRRLTSFDITKNRTHKKLNLNSSHHDEAEYKNITKLSLNLGSDYICSKHYNPD
jgi:hypothetical protein